MFTYPPAATSVLGHSLPFMANLMGGWLFVLSQVSPVAAVEHFTALQKARYIAYASIYTIGALVGFFGMTDRLLLSTPEIGIITSGNAEQTLQLEVCLSSGYHFAIAHRGGVGMQLLSWSYGLANPLKSLKIRCRYFTYQGQTPPSASQRPPIPDDFDESSHFFRVRVRQPLKLAMVTFGLTFAIAVC